MIRFLKSASNSDQWIDDQTSEICFVGRSNVGKSSLINALAKQKIAKTSKTPGRTQLVNFYDFDHFRLVDLPGYGFAKVSKTKQIMLQEMIYEYLFNRINLYAVFQVCDANIITKDDQKFSKLIQEKFVNYFVILNKIDKLSKKELEKDLKKIAHKLHVDLNQIILVSAKNKNNLNAIFKTIDSLLKTIQ